MIDFGVEMINKLVDKGFNSPTDKPWWIGKLLDFMKVISPAEYTKAYFAVYNQLPLDFENPYEPDSSLEVRLTKLAVRLHDEGSYVNSELVSRAVDELCQLKSNITLNWSNISSNYSYANIGENFYSINAVNTVDATKPHYIVKYDKQVIGVYLQSMENAKDVALKHYIDSKR